VVTNDDQLAAKIRLMCNFGFSGYDNVVYSGTSGKMTEVCAAMGITSLEAITELVDNNQRNYECYQRGLRGLNGLSLISYDSCDANNFQYIVVEVNPDVAGLTRDELVEVLHAENVLARKYFWPGCHRMEPYKSYYPNAGLLVPENERVSARIIVLPTGTAVGSGDIELICRIVRMALGRSAELRHVLRERRAKEIE